jgi:hypothetical protein
MPKKPAGPGPAQPKGAPPVRAAKPTPPELIPRVIAAPTLDDHLDVMTRAIFQAGLSWAFIESRWHRFRPAFANFSVAAVAAYGGGDVERLMTADGIVHSRSKIVATIANARALQALVAEFGDVPAYASAFASYDALFADAKKRFAYLGDLSCFYWLFRTGLPVMTFERWMERQASDHPRMREMVLLARRENRSSEVS